MSTPSTRSPVSVVPPALQRYRDLCDAGTCVRCAEAPARPDMRTCSNCKGSGARHRRARRYRCGQCGARGHNRRSCNGTLAFSFARLDDPPPAGEVERSAPASSEDVRTGGEA